ncbi:hypothetical protein [Pantoea sp. Tr-811]|nr:hypothetical protein [Pantoea sp. Tr-811]
MGFLTSAGQIRSILALPARALQGSAGLYDRSGNAVICVQIFRNQQRNL